MENKIHGASARFTPGPWTVFTNMIGVCGIGQEGSQFDPEGKSVVHAMGDGYLWITAADARLIAAAPDLLEACKMAVGFAVDFRQRHPKDWQEFEDVGRLFAITTEAIAKAEGGVA